MPDTPRLYRMSEVTRLLGVTRQTVYGLMRAGHLESVTIGKCRCVPGPALDQFIERLRSEGKVVPARSPSYYRQRERRAARAETPASNETSGTKARG